MVCPDRRIAPHSRVNVVEQRPLGKSDLTISAITLGCATLGREIDEDTSRQVLDHALDRGITFLDSAETYGGGNARLARIQNHGIDDTREASHEMSSSECTLGRWMKARGCRTEITLCTKVSSGASPKNIRRALAASLERLRTDWVDVYKLHSPDPKVPIQETLAALNEEVDAGRIRALGGSNFSGDQMREALEVSRSRGYARFEITQPPYNLALREDEADLFPLCREERIAVATYSPLGAGFFAGKYTSAQSVPPSRTRFDIVPDFKNIYFKDRNFRLMERLRRKAEEMGVPMVRLGVAWAASNPEVTSVIIGAKEKVHIDNALAAIELHLSPEQRAEIATLADE